MSNKNILIIDDEDGVLETLSEILSTGNYNVKTANESGLALELLGKETFDLILSDIAMPNQSGIDLVLSIRKIGVDTPIIFMSGHYEMSQKILQSLGVKDFIKKPFRPAELIEKINANL